MSAIDDYTARMIRLCESYDDVPQDKDEVLSWLEKQVENLQEKMYLLGGISEDEKKVLEESIVVPRFRINWEKVWEDMGWDKEWDDSDDEDYETALCESCGDRRCCYKMEVKDDKFYCPSCHKDEK